MYHYTKKYVGLYLQSYIISITYDMIRKFLKFLLPIVVFVPSVLFSQTPLTSAPNFNALDAHGDYLDLYTHLDNGKYVLLYFFYDTCFVSQSNVPEIDNAYIKFGCNSNDVFFFGINFNNTDGEVLSFENNFGLHYPNVSGIDGGGNQIVSLFQVIAFPTIILIAPDRSIPKQDIWPLTAVNIIDELASLGIDTTVSCPNAAIYNPAISSNFQVYPNPANDWLNISNSSKETNLSIKLTDNLGKTVVNKNISHFTKESVNVNNLNPGIYFLQISNAHAILFSKKIILF